jgi:DNA (cytosine-5)-methyltransferase 1
MGHPNPIFAWRSKFSDFLYKADPNMPVRTLKAQGGQYTGPFHWDNRPFGINELKRLQTFPDDYDIVGGRNTIIQQIGNAVPPQIARILALSILKQIFSIELPFSLPLLEPTEQLGFRKRKRSLTDIYAKRAKDAIQLLNNRKIISFRNKRYAASLGLNFEWKEADINKGDFIVDVSIGNNELLIRVFKGDLTEQQFEVVIEPANNKKWTLGVKRVILQGSSLEPDCYTATWKAFEYELINTGIKADLVQLSGYYQYGSAIDSRIKINKDQLTNEWKVVKLIVEGVGVRYLVSEQELAELWDVPLIEISTLATFLRILGYEVRNKNTNPQIPDGYYLIPYSFPTLTPLSVQLYKSLG